MADPGLLEEEFPDEGDEVEGEFDEFDGLLDCGVGAVEGFPLLACAGGVAFGVAFPTAGDWRARAGMSAKEMYRNFFFTQILSLKDDFLPFH